MDAFESIITSSRDSEIIASALLDAAQDAMRSSGGAVLLMTSNPEVFEVTATTAPDLFPMGKRVRGIRTPKGGRSLVLKASGVEFGKVILLAMDDVLSYVVYLAESLVRGNCATSRPRPMAVKLC